MSAREPVYRLVKAITYLSVGFLLVIMVPGSARRVHGGSRSRPRKHLVHRRPRRWLPVGSLIISTIAIVGMQRAHRREPSPLGAAVKSTRTGVAGRRHDQS